MSTIDESVINEVIMFAFFGQLVTQAWEWGVIITDNGPRCPLDGSFVNQTPSDEMLLSTDYACTLCGHEYWLPW